MLMIALEKAPPRLRGRLALWLLEVRAGVYVGGYSARTRDRVWNLVEATLGPKGNAVMAWSAGQSPLGIEFRTLGEQRRMPVELDGIWLMEYRPGGRGTGTKGDQGGSDSG